MSQFSKRTQVIEEYWFAIFGKGPVGSCCIAVSVVLLAVIYAIAMLWMVPASVFRALRIENSIA